MGRVRTGYKDLSHQDDLDACNVYITDVVDQASIDKLINSDPNEEETRSQWLWVHFPNGDLMLATFPQGDMYFELEGDHSRSDHTTQVTL